ncbi:MAG: dienelactone hydrolase family protein [Candidatus Krumholzibacteriota bacterium]|nr:dienelactone hydrolase family protein [Candidatus Krumholzibacteriota bacterium]
MPAREAPCTIPGPAGPLDALFLPPAAPAAGACLLLHPHTLWGGHMRSKVIHACQRVCAGRGLATLRVNFRGAGASAGFFDDGQGEQDDARAALAWLRAETRGPVHLLGFSFGAWIALRVGAADGAVASLTAVGTPVAWAELDFLADCALPKLFLHGTEDQHCDPAELARVAERAAPPSTLRWIEGADHFFAGKLAELAAALEEAFPG